MAFVLIRNRIHRSSRSQYTRLYCKLTCCNVFVRLWLKLTVYPLFAFLPVSMHFRPLMPCRSVSREAATEAGGRSKASAACKKRSHHRPRVGSEELRFTGSDARNCTADASRQRRHWAVPQVTRRKRRRSSAKARARLHAGCVTYFQRGTLPALQPEQGKRAPCRAACLPARPTRSRSDRCAQPGGRQRKESDAHSKSDTSVPRHNDQASGARSPVCPAASTRQAPWPLASTTGPSPEASTSGRWDSGPTLERASAAACQVATMRCVSTPSVCPVLAASACLLVRSCCPHLALALTSLRARSSCFHSKLQTEVLREGISQLLKGAAVRSQRQEAWLETDNLPPPRPL
jgi:hypothetical protein